MLPGKYPWRDMLLFVDALRSEVDYEAFPPILV